MQRSMKGLRAVAVLLGAAFVVAAAPSRASFQFTVYNSGGATALTSVTLHQLLYQGYWVNVNNGTQDLNFTSFGLATPFVVDPPASVDTTKVVVTGVGEGDSSGGPGVGLKFTTDQLVAQPNLKELDVSFSYAVQVKSGAWIEDIHSVLGDHVAAQGGGVDISEYVALPGSPYTSIASLDVYDDYTNVLQESVWNPDSVHFAVGYQGLVVQKDISVVGGANAASSIGAFEQRFTPVPESSCAQLLALLGVTGLVGLRRRRGGAS